MTLIISNFAVLTDGVSDVLERLLQTLYAEYLNGRQ